MGHYFLVELSLNNFDFMFYFHENRKISELLSDLARQIIGWVIPIKNLASLWMIMILTNILYSSIYVFSISALGSLRDLKYRIIWFFGYKGADFCPKLISNSWIWWLLQFLLKNKSMTIWVKAFKKRLEKQKIQKLIVRALLYIRVPIYYKICE